MRFAYIGEEPPTAYCDDSQSHLTDLELQIVSRFHAAGQRVPDVALDNWQYVYREAWDGGEWRDSDRWVNDWGNRMYYRRGNTTWPERARPAVPQPNAIHVINDSDYRAIAGRFSISNRGQREFEQVAVEVFFSDDLVLDDEDLAAGEVRLEGTFPRASRGEVGQEFGFEFYPPRGLLCERPYFVLLRAKLEGGESEELLDDNVVALPFGVALDKSINDGFIVDWIWCEPAPFQRAIPMEPYEPPFVIHLWMLEWWLNQQEDP